MTEEDQSANGQTVPTLEQRATASEAPASPSVHAKVLEASDHLRAGDVEEGLEALAEFFDWDAQQQTHEIVKACLEGARDACRQAAFDWYASFK